MKNSNKFWLLLIVSSFILQTSCSRQAFVEREEGQIVGEWSFTRVRITSFINLEIENITSTYRDASITFNEDYSVKIVKNGELLEGTWTYNIVDGSENSVRQLVLQLKNKDTGENTLMLWDSFNVTNRRMWAREDFNKNSLIHYQLIKSSTPL